MMSLQLLFAIRIDPTDPDLVAGLQGLVVAANADAAAAAAPALPAPPPPQQPPAPRGRGPRWADSARSLPPPISSLRRRPALVRTRTADGRLVITEDHGEGSGSGASGGRGGLICTRRRERDGQGHLTMSLV